MVLHTYLVFECDKCHKQFNPIAFNRNEAIAKFQEQKWLYDKRDKCHYCAECRKKD